MLRERLVKGKSIKAYPPRAISVLRDTVRKILRSGE